MNGDPRKVGSNAFKGAIVIVWGGFKSLLPHVARISIEMVWQREAVEHITGRRFEPDQMETPTVPPSQPTNAGRAITTWRPRPFLTRRVLAEGSAGAAGSAHWSEFLRLQRCTSVIAGNRQQLYRGVRGTRLRERFASCLADEASKALRGCGAQE